MYLLSNISYLLIMGIVLVLAILSILMPFFIMQIRDSAKRMEQKMDRIIALLSDGYSDEVTSPVFQDDPAIKRCLACGAKNRKIDYTCINCGKPV